MPQGNDQVWYQGGKTDSRGNRIAKENTMPLWDELAGKDYSRELLDEILL